MQIRTKLVLCVGTLAAVVIASSALLLWNTHLANYNQQRTKLAYSELTGYLQLSGEVFRTFKQVRRDILNSGGTLTFDLDQAQGRIAEIASRINQVALNEADVGLRSGEGGEDVERANALNKELVGAFADVRRAEALVKGNSPNEGRSLLEKSLQTRIDGAISQIINRAVTDENEELDEALADIELLNDRAYWAAIMATLTGIILTAWVINTLAMRLRTSLVNLESGAEVFATGRLDHKIPVVGQDEFAMLSHRFNTMASQLSHQRNALEDARDMLEQRVSERTDELRSANAELKRRDETRRQFFADIGHELRTPITAVRGEAEVALRVRENQRKTYHSALGRIVEITDQLTRFVNDIFLIAREQAGVSDMRRSELDLREPAKMAAEQLHSLIEKSHCEVLMDLGTEAAMIEGDSQRLCQLVQILISNAIKHSPVDTVVRVTLAQKENEWELSVEDNGPGISEEDAIRVFERFYRGDSHNDQSGIKNTGLGLPIARSITNAHGGKIVIDNSYTDGTAVRITFPVLHDAASVRGGVVDTMEASA